MNKAITLLLLVFLSISTCGIYAQNHHPFEVKRLSYWAPEYLTWTCGYKYKATPSEDGGDITSQVKILQKDGFKESDYIWIDKEQSSNIPPIGSIITEIDGQTTKGMSESKFFNIVDSANRHTLKDNFGVNIDTAQIVLKETPKWLEILGISIFKGHCWKYTTLATERKDNANGDKDISFDVIFDTDIDWNKYHTYDFAIRGNDPLNDKILLKAIAENFSDFFDGVLTRDKDNPDLIFTIAKGSDQSINTTYVPPVIENIRTGSKTTTRYNWITHKNDYITKDQYTTTKQDGYTKQDKVMNVFFEFTMLDAKQLKKESSTPPIVYQATFKRTAVNPDYDLEEEYQNLCSWFALPLSERLTSCKWRSGVYGRFAPSGMYITTPPNGDAVVIHIIAGSDADKAGVQRRDLIRKRKVKDGKYILDIIRDRKKIKISIPCRDTFVLDYKDGLELNFSALDK